MAQKPLNQKLLRALIYTVLALFVLTVALAWVLYPDPYYFFRYFVSELGATETLTGSDNTTSRYLFGVGIMLCGLVALTMAVIYFVRNQKSILNILKGLMLLTMAVGSYGVLNPYDLIQNKQIHPLGAMLFVIGLDLFTFLCQFLRFKNRKISLDTGESVDATVDKFFVYVILAVSIAFLVFALLGLQAWLPPTQKVILIVAGIGIILLDEEDM